MVDYSAVAGNIYFAGPFFKVKVGFPFQVLRDGGNVPSKTTCVGELSKTNSVMCLCVQKHSSQCNQNRPVFTLSVYWNKVDQAVTKVF